MKAKELMIGDLVYHGTNHLIKIKHNYGKSVRYDEDGYSHEVEETLIHPIPLTHEMLEANGWFYNDLEGVWLATFKFPALYDDINGLLNYYDGYEIKYIYVHELQHALRLCGLNDIADGFKVE